MKNSKTNTIVEGFWQYLKKGGNLSLVPEILSGLTDRMNETVSLATVMSSNLLTKEQEGKIIKIIDSNFGIKRVQFEVDPSLIGGIKVKIGDTVLDLSLKSKLESLAKSI